MAETSQTFETRIKAVDEASATLRMVAASMEKLGRQSKALVVEEEREISTLGRLRESYALTVERTEGLREHFGEFRESVSETHEGLTELVPMLAAFGAAASITGLVDMVREAAEARTQLSAMAETLGTTVPQLQALRLAASETDVPIDTLQTGMMRLQKNVAAAAGGKNKEVAEIFGRMGISFRDAGGHLKSANDLLPLIAQSLSKTEDSTLRNAVAMQLFGRAGAELIPFLNKGKKGIEDYQKTSARLNASYSPEDDESVEKFKNSWVELDTAMTGFKDTVTADVAPVLTPLIKHLTDWVAANKEVLASSITADVQALATAAKSVNWARVGKDIEAFGHSMTLGADAVGGWQVVIKGLAGLAALKLIVSAVGPVVELGKIGTAAGALVLKLAGLAKAWDKVGDHAAAAGVKEEAAAGAGGAGHFAPAAGAAGHGEDERTSSTLKNRGAALGLNTGLVIADLWSSGGRPLTAQDAVNFPEYAGGLSPDQKKEYERLKSQQARTSMQTAASWLHEGHDWLFGTPAAAPDVVPAGSSTTETPAAAQGAGNGSVMVHVNVTSELGLNPQVRIGATTGVARPGDVVDVGHSYPMGYPDR